MATRQQSCPSIAEIERLADGEDASAGLTSHLETCGECRARLEAARKDAEFLGRVRALANPGLGPQGAPRIPGYRTLGVVSAGAQGVVYRAVQEATSRTVAIKTLVAGEAATHRQRIRAEREAEIAARLRHPNIVTVFESRTLSDGRIAVVMEYIDGVPLDAWKPPGESESERQKALLRVFVTVCNAIHHAHLNGVIHRDLKPDNILVTPEGRPVVLDFGIAKAGGLRTTMTGEFAGTPAYASPEQVAGRPDDVNALTDVYSLGVILYRLLCGAMPYRVEGSIFDMAQTIGTAEPTAPRLRNPALPIDLEAIVLRTLRKEQERRYQSAAGLTRDIERFLCGAPVEARSGSGWYLLRKAVMLNRRRLAWAGAGLVMVLGAGIAVAISLSHAADSARLAALRQEQARAESVRARAVTELLREALPNENAAQPELQAIIGAGLGRLFFRLETGAFADDPEVDQALRRMWGGVYTGFGGGKAAALVEYAEVSLRNGLARLRQEHGEEHQDVAATMHELAGVLLVRKRAPEAERLCRGSLQMREKLLGPGSIDTADSRALLARILLSMGRTDEAARESDIALAALSGDQGRQADLLIGSLTALKARARLNAGDVVQCEPLMREALLRRLRRLAPEHPELLASLADAADFAALSPRSALTSQLSTAWGSSSESLPADLRRDLPVLATPDRIVDQAGFSRTGHTAALGRLLRLQESMLGPEDPALVGVLIAQIRAAEGERDLATRAQAALRAADLLSHRFGPNDSSVLACVEEAAVVTAFDGRTDEAVELGRRACAIRDAGPAGARDELLAGDSRRNLGWYLCLAGRCGEAVQVYRRAVDELRRAVGTEHHTTALAESGLAFCLADSGELGEADELSLRALDLAQRLPATPADQLSNIRVARGHVLRALGRNSEAVAMLEQAWVAHLKFAGPQFAWRRIILQDLGAACEAAGDVEAAASWRALVEKDLFPLSAH